MIKTLDEMKYAVESLRFRLPQVVQVITAADTQQMSDADRYLILAYYALMELQAVRAELLRTVRVSNSRGQRHAEAFIIEAKKLTTEG